MIPVFNVDKSTLDQQTSKTAGIVPGSFITKLNNLHKAADSSLKLKSDPTRKI
jgi:hypothetical protein